MSNVFVWTIYLRHSAMNNLFHHRTTCANTITQTTIDIRNLESFDAIMDDVNRHTNICDIKLSLTNTLHDDLRNEIHLGTVKLLTHLLHQPDVTEELGTQIAIAYHGFLDKTKVGVNQLTNLSSGSKSLSATSFRRSLMRVISRSMTA